MSNRGNQDGARKAGALALVMIVCVVVLAVCVSVAVGMHYGAAWGWTMAALFVMSALIRLSVTLTRMMGGRKDE